MSRINKRTEHRKKRKSKVIWSIIIILVLFIGGGAALAYYKLNPSNHFSHVPTASTNNKFKQDFKNGFNVLLIGSDERKGQKVGHSDSMVLVHVNLKTHKYYAVSVPRDSRVLFKGHGYTKLTTIQYITQVNQGPKKGVLAAVNAVSNLTGVPINYYVETNYNGLQSMVDALGKVTIKVPFDVRLTHPWYWADKNKVFTKGTHTMDGKQVTELVHERYSLPHGEYSRQLLQEKALSAIAKEALKPTNLPKLPGLVNSIHSFVIDTNMSTSDMLSLGMAVKGFKQSQLQYFQLKGTTQSMYDDVLQNKNDEIILDQANMKKVMAHFK